MPEKNGVAFVSQLEKKSHDPKKATESHANQKGTTPNAKPPQQNKCLIEGLLTAIGIPLRIPYTTETEVAFWTGGKPSKRPPFFQVTSRRLAKMRQRLAERKGEATGAPCGVDGWNGGRV